MASRYWPFFDLCLRTSRLVLRLPTDGELEGVAHLAAGGIHDPAVMPFAVPWTDAPPGELERLEPLEVVEVGERLAMRFDEGGRSV